MNSKKFISDAKDVINLEIKALQKLKQSINHSFNKAVVQIARCQSKVILCGVGKSGLIASKIAATLSSVGTPSQSASSTVVVDVLSVSSQSLPKPAAVKE